MQILNLNLETQGITSLQTIEHPIISFSNVLTYKPFPNIHSDFTIKKTNLFLTINDHNNTQVIEIPIVGPYKFGKNITIGNFVISCDNQKQYDNITIYIDNHLNQDIIEDKKVEKDVLSVSKEITLSDFEKLFNKAWNLNEPIFWKQDEIDMITIDGLTTSLESFDKAMKKAIES